MALRAEHGANRPEPPAAAAGAHREAATGLHLDYDRSTVRSASEEVRCMRDQFGRLVAPGGDADYCRVEIQRHHVIAFPSTTRSRRGRRSWPTTGPLRCR